MLQAEAVSYAASCSCKLKLECSHYVVPQTDCRLINTQPMHSVHTHTHTLRLTSHSAMQYPQARTAVQVARMTDAQLLADVKDGIEELFQYECYAQCWDHQHREAPYCCCEGFTFEEIKKGATDLFKVAGTRVTDALLRQVLQQGVNDTDADGDTSMTSKTIDGAERWVSCQAFDEPAAAAAAAAVAH
jgi:hypothetical protein